MFDPTVSGDHLLMVMEDQIFAFVGRRRHIKKVLEDEVVIVGERDFSHPVRAIRTHSGAQAMIKSRLSRSLSESVHVENYLRMVGVEVSRIDVRSLVPARFPAKIELVHTQRWLQEAETLE